MADRIFEASLDDKWLENAAAAHEAKWDEDKHLLADPASGGSPGDERHRRHRSGRQMVVVCDHDSRVLARRTFRCKAWDLDAALDWARESAGRAGFVGVPVACEPTGHRWRVLGHLAADLGMPFVCVQPMLTSWPSRTEDLTTDKTDDKYAVLISLTAQMRCYLPQPVDETWGRLRHLGVRRAELLVEHVACVQQIRDLLECVWPAALATAQQPFKSVTWVAAMHVIVVGDGGDLARTRRLGAARFERQAHREVLRRDKSKPFLRILRQLYTALSDTAGVLAHRPGALERIGWVLTDWDTTGISPVIMGSPNPSSNQPDHTLEGWGYPKPHSTMQGPTTGQGTDPQLLTYKASR